jgi:sugar lactone lactonase YvrE
MVFQQASGHVLVADLGLGVVWSVDPVSGGTSMFMQAPTIVPGKSPGLNALTIDKSGNVYTSDSLGALRNALDRPPFEAKAG